MGRGAYNKIGRGSKMANTLARRLRKECKREGMSFDEAIDYGMRLRVGMSREDVVSAARMAYRIDLPTLVLYEGGMVRPR